VFTVVSRLLLKQQHATTAEIVEAVRSEPEFANVKEDSRITDLLKELAADKWLARNDRNLWEIGPRAYLELSAYFQDVVTELTAAGVMDDEDEEAVPTGRTRGAAGRVMFPQLIMY
jgi:hypothetical protein